MPFTAIFGVAGLGELAGFPHLVKGLPARGVVSTPRLAAMSMSPRDRTLIPGHSTSQSDGASANSPSPLKPGALNFPVRN